MAHSRRGVNRKFLHFCPNCKSKNLVRNGHPHGAKLEFFCKSCKKYFTKDSIKGYPPSKLPFPIISYFLYFRRKIPEFSNMRKFRKFVNHWLKYLKVSDQEVSRQTVHHWIKNYEIFLDKVITFSEARDYYQQKLKRVLPPPVQKPLPYGSALKVLEGKFGKSYCVNLIRSDPVFFQELVDIVSRHGVFGWEFLEAGFGGGSVGYRSLSTG
ncbi:hypothetical protein MBGDF03_00823 [Thermoplasmatales archaeon SCGC AB-540-F20]|nr:hypothetical protein MBGDF03_00823 [Thermoplasmatales archaeon SCGC AB-540-F20]